MTRKQACIGLIGDYREEVAAHTAIPRAIELVKETMDAKVA